MKTELDRYRYIVTIHEYCDFCLELLARSAIAQAIKAELLQTCGTHVESSYTRFSDTITKFMIPKFRKSYGIKYTLEDFNTISERARIEYNQSNGDLDSYLSSAVVQDFKIRFMGNQLTNWKLIEDWINFFGSSFPDEDARYEVLGSMDLVITMPAFDIYDVAPVTKIKITNTLMDERFNSHYWRYFKAPIEVVNTIARECPRLSVRFNPTKFMLLGYSLSYIAFDHRRYFTNSNKYKSIFKLIELVFGDLTPRELIWVTHSVYCWAPRLSPARSLPLFNYSDARWKKALKSIKHLASSETRYRTAFESLEIVKGIEFVPEAQESLKMYRVEKKTNP